MIIAPFSGRWLVVTQTDHAHFAGELLALWRAGGLPDHPRRRALLFAAREHDNGWAEIDSAPMCGADGRPLDFMGVPRDVRWDIWRRGTRRHAESRPYSALLIVRHALYLHRSQRRDPEWSDLFAEWHDLEAELMEATGAEAADVEHDYRWIELTDVLSLAVCNRWAHEIERPGQRAALHGVGAAGDDPAGGDPTGPVAGGTLVLDPFPLAGDTTFQVACRLIPDRSYDGDADLGTELAIARWRQLVVRVRSPSRSPSRTGGSPSPGVDREG